MNYIHNEEFEMRDGIYVSENRIMGEGFYIDRKSPFGKFFEELLYRDGVEGLRRYVGAGKNEVIVVDGNKVYTEEVDPNDWGLCCVKRFGTKWYMFSERSTLLVDPNNWPVAVDYAEVHDDFEFRVKSLPLSALRGMMMDYIVRSSVRDAVRDFIEWDGRVLMVFSDVWGDFLTGRIEVESDKKSFYCEAKLNTSDWKLILNGVPFVEGVYSLSIPARGGAVRITEMSVKKVPRHVRKTLMYGPGANRVLYPGVKGIRMDERDRVYLEGDGYRVYIDEDGFGVSVISGTRWFDYDEWEPIIRLLMTGKEAIELV